MKLNRFILPIIVTILVLGCNPVDVDIFGSIYGIVSDSQSGQPIANAEITLSPGNESTISGSTGRFEFKDLDAGQYKVSVQAEGYEFNNKQVTVVPGERVSCDISLIAKDGLKVEPSSLNFESIHTHLAVSITNIGGAEVAWQLDLQNVNWLSANPKSGRIASKKVQTIVFSVNRDYVSSEKSVVLNLTSNGNSYPIAISCLPKGTSKGELTLNKTSINFGETSSEEELELKNTGTAAVNWQLKDVVSTSISLSDSLGTIDAGGSKVIKVYLDREKLTQDLNTSFTISDGTKDHSVSVSAKKVTKQSKMEVSPTELDFGESKSELSLTIKNTGTANLNWEIDKLTESSLSVSDSEGVIEPNGTKVVKVMLDRSKMTGDINTTFVVSDGTSDKPVSVKAVKKTAEAVMKITPSEIDFGQDSSEEYIIIKNEGTAALKWTLNQISEECISVSDTAGVVNPGGSKVLKVSLDREIMPSSISTSLIFSDGTHEEVVIVRGTRVDKKANMVVSPTELDFGDDKSELSFDISNIGSAELKWSVLDIDESLFSLSKSEGTIAVNGKTTVTLTLKRSAMKSDLDTFFYITDGVNKVQMNVTAKYVLVEDYSTATISTPDSRITAQIISCKRDGNNVVLKYQLLNTGFGIVQDWFVYPPGASSSLAYDNLGTEYSYDKAIVEFRGKQSVRGSRSCIVISFPEDVPCQGSVTLFDVPETASKAYFLLEVDTWDHSNSFNMGTKRIEFKNVPIY